MSGPSELHLCGGTLLQASLPELVRAAAFGGFASISVWPHQVRRARDEGLRDGDLRALLADSGVEVREVEPLLDWIPGAAPPAGVESAGVDELLALGEALGARTLLAMEGFGAGASADRLAEAFADLCDRAAERGMAVGLEFLPWSAVPDAATARDVVTRAGRPNGGVVVDSWHHFRGANDVGQLRALPGELVVSVQLSDAPAEPDGPPAGESMRARLAPGDGAIDLVSLVRALDAIGSNAPIGVEVFSRALAALPPAAVARRLGDAARAVLAEARGGARGTTPGRGARERERRTG